MGWEEELRDINMGDLSGKKSESSLEAGKNPVEEKLDTFLDNCITGWFGSMLGDRTHIPENAKEFLTYLVKESEKCKLPGTIAHWNLYAALMWGLMTNNVLSPMDNMIKALFIGMVLAKLPPECYIG